MTNYSFETSLPQELKKRQEDQLKEALLKISQMSDCGSYEQTIIKMKDIAVNALNKLNE